MYDGYFYQKTDRTCKSCTLAKNIVEHFTEAPRETDNHLSVQYSQFVWQPFFFKPLNRLILLDSLEKFLGNGTFEEAKYFRIFKLLMPFPKKLLPGPVFFIAKQRLSF